MKIYPDLWSSLPAAKTPTRGSRPGEADSSPPCTKASNVDPLANPFYSFKTQKASILISEKQALTQSIRSMKKRLRNLGTQKQLLELLNMRWLIKCKARSPKSWTSARSLNTSINYMEQNRGKRHLPTTVYSLVKWLSKAFALSNCLIGVGIHTERVRVGRSTTDCIKNVYKQIARFRLCSST